MGVKAVWSSCARPLAYRRPDDPATSSRMAGPEQMSATRGDVEGTLVRIPKGTVRGRVNAYWHRVGLQDSAPGIPDVDHRARAAGIGAGRGHDIPLSIQAHTINAPLRSPVVFAELMQHDIGPREPSARMS